MVWVSNVQFSSNDGNIFHLSLSEGDVRSRVIGHYGWVIIVANEEESQAGCHRVISNDTNYPTLKSEDKKIIVASYTNVYMSMKNHCT